MGVQSRRTASLALLLRRLLRNNAGVDTDHRTVWRLHCDPPPSRRRFELRDILRLRARLGQHRRRNVRQPILTFPCLLHS